VIPTGYHLRPMEDADVAEVADLEQRTFQSPWSARAFRHELERNAFARCYVLRTAADALAGYACVWHLEGELLINNVAIAPAHRRRGLGRGLLSRLLEDGRAAGCRRALLEVRPSNEGARRLYGRMGFREVGRRRGYYSDGEDALVLAAGLGETGPEGVGAA
jgi:ribosomal-protein-alanine N-acetyltransferase